MFWAALGQSLPQAVGIAVSPVPIILVVLILVTARPRAGGLAFAAGWVAGVFAVAVIAFALSDSAHVYTDHEAADGANVIQIVLGLFFIAMAVWEWRKRPRPGAESKPPKIFSAIGSLSPPKVLGIGFAAAAVNPANLPLAISGGLTIAQAGATTGQGIAAVVVFTVLADSSVLIPIAAFLFLGDRARGPLDALKTWLIANNSTILIILFAVLAAKMLGSGLAVF